MIKKSAFRIAILILFASTLFAADPPSGAADRRFQALKYRNIGPSRGGRSSAVTGIPGQMYTFYMGAAGGVWKTTNAGQSWANITDGYLECGSIGAITVADSDPNVIYVGTGQTTIRGNVSSGVGMYKSTDAGRTWGHVGLRKAGQIGRIRIHPNNPDLVYVAALGNAFVPNEDRGLYRSSDGGKNWERMLYVSPKTGIVDLSMDAKNPRVLYASAWTGQRKPWTIVSGSEESALYKSVDAGDTWVKLSGGLPQGVVGKIGVAVSPANPDRVWALVEAENGGLFRSDDAGQTWKLLDTNMKRRLFQRAWYYMHIYADPKDAQQVYILNVDQFRSKDGGLTFESFDVPHGDGHDLWINPDDTRVMALASDGGASVSLDHAQTWSTLLNQPTAEMYFVNADEQFPYRIYGAQQDNTTISLPSRALPGLTDQEHWMDMGGCESGHIDFEPRNPSVVYAGCYGGEISRLDVKTRELTSIMHYPQMEIGLAAKDLRYRFNWNTPIRVSRHNPTVLYQASQFVHKSTNQGQTWEIISPDLSRNDKSKQGYSGEPITYENTGIEVYSNIVALEESPLREGLIWAGSDDGLVHITQDGGKSWKNITPAALPEWSTINHIEPSPHDPARAFFAAHKYRLGDPNPYLFVTNDYGNTWTLLTSGKNGIPAGMPTRVVREDPARKGLLYAGTESGIFVSTDDGKLWNSLQLNLPRVPVNDLKVHHNDLLAATTGRSFWILDDLTVVQQMASSQASGSFFLKPRETYRMRMEASDENPPNGALLFYYLPDEVKGEISLEIADANGRLIQKFSSEENPSPNPEFPYGFMGRYYGDKKLSKKAGLNRFVWDLRHPVVHFPDRTIVWGFLGGPRVAPGTYQATLKIGDLKQSQSLVVLKDPQVAASDKDLEEQFGMALQIRDQLNRLYAGVTTLRSVRQQARDIAARLKDAGKPSEEVKKAADQLWQKLSTIEDELMQPRNQADQDTENFPTKLDNQLAYIYMQLEFTDARPTAGQKERHEELARAIDAQMMQLKGLLEKDVPAFQQLSGIKLVVPDLN